MNNKLLTGIALLFTVFLAGCSTQNVEDGTTIVASFYATEEIVSEIVGNSSNTELLLPKSADPHSYEPSVRQIASLSEAEVFVKMGGLFESIEEAVIESNPQLRVIDATHHLELIEDSHDHEHHNEEHADEHDSHHNEEHEHSSHHNDEEHTDEHDSHHEEEHEHSSHHNEEHADEHDSHHEEEHDHHGKFDPHVWLSIENMKIMTEEIVEELNEIYPQHSEKFQNNANEYISKLNALEQEFEQGLSTCNKDKIIVNHQAFGYLASEYGFEQISVAGFSPEIEPTPNTISKVIDEAKEHNLNFVFSEGQFDSRTAQTIADDIEGEVLELNPLLQNRHENYFDMMRENLEQLKIGLECE